MIELHYIEVAFFLFLWAYTLFLSYKVGVFHASKIMDDYRRAVEQWGESIKYYKELKCEYEKLLEDFKEQSKMHMN